MKAIWVCLIVTRPLGVMSPAIAGRVMVSSGAAAIRQNADLRVMARALNSVPSLFIAASPIEGAAALCAGWQRRGGLPPGGGMLVTLVILGVCPVIGQHNDMNAGDGGTDGPWSRSSC